MEKPFRILRRTEVWCRGRSIGVQAEKCLERHSFLPLIMLIFFPFFPVLVGSPNRGQSPVERGDFPYVLHTVESCSNGPTSNGDSPITEDILWYYKNFFKRFFIGNNRNPPITDENNWSLEIR